MAITLTAFRNRASLLASAFGVGFTDWFDGLCYLLGSYRLTIYPEAHSFKPTSFKSTRFDSPANKVGPWPLYASKLCVTSNAESRWRTAESAGEWWGDIGRDDLLGRLVGGWFLGGGSPYGWRRIDQAAVVDDLFDLRAVEGLVFEQRFCDRLEFVAVTNERVLGQLIGFVDEPAHFLVDLFGS